MSVVDSPTKLDRQKQARVRELRLQFCVRKEFSETGILIKTDGTLNRDYFSVKLQQDDKEWAAEEMAALQEGIQKFGVGKFNDIQRDFLPDRSINLLKVKTMRLLGVRDLRRYLGWRGSAELIGKEYAKNKATGQEQQNWINGVVDPTQAAKRKAMEELKAEEEKGKRRRNNNS